MMVFNVPTIRKSRCLSRKYGGHGDLDDNLDVDRELVEVHDAVESCPDPLREPNQATK